MIYTVTFNPAVDYVCTAEKITLGAVNRLENEQIFFGGKGINVSLMLAELGVSSKALGFIAGFTGDAIENGLRAKGIDTDFVRLDSGFSRINVKLSADRETQLDGSGPFIPEEKQREFFRKIDTLKSGDTIVIAGSIPNSMNSDTYEAILERLSGRGVRAIVDASGDLLLNTLKYQPFLIKPNHLELSAIFGEPCDTVEAAVRNAEKLRKTGARNVIVSMAEMGAVLLDEDGNVYQCGICKGKLKNSTGAGDSMVAGFIAGCETGDMDYALKLGTAAGGATAFSFGLGTRAQIDEFMRQFG